MKELRWVVGTSTVTTLLSTAVLIIVIILMALRYNVSQDSVCTVPGGDENITVDATCVEERELNDTCIPTDLNGYPLDNCTVGYYLTNQDNVCQHEAAPGGTPCVNRCYVDGAVSTACDYQGNCTGSDPTECLGFCETDADCNASIPVNTWWLTHNVSAFITVNTLVSYSYNCFLNACRLFTLDHYAMSGVEETTALSSQSIVAVAALMDCSYFLDVNWAGDRLGCLTTESYLIDPNLTNPINGSFDVPTQPPDPPGRIYIEPQWQYRLCSFSMNCAPLNTTGVDKKRKRRTYDMPLSSYLKPVNANSKQEEVSPWSEYMARGARKLLIKALYHF